ncbi:MAG: hypothetical protein Q8N17_25840 [Burkholderiaceae bacterium]|nr:hypothetical protein [Burkholderiaceae bacterium]
MVDALREAVRRLASARPVYCAVAAASLVLLGWRCAMLLHELVLGLARH